MDDTLEYVIYCRKSSDESSDNQKQSIPDQIKACIKYAENEGVKIKEKPSDFSMFENELDLEKEDKEEDIENRRIFQNTRNLFIIKEEETGKIPSKRKKWRKLISLIKKKKINALLSYSPDRQARNMLEWGELIDLVDQNKSKENKLAWITILDLKYTNFHFQDNAAGKMMLWIWFVFSKQYSDKLWEDITRWNESKVTSWKWIGRYKPWYFVNEQGYHQPDEKNFPLIQEAFKMKIDGEKEPYILDWLHSNGYKRVYKKNKRESNISSTSLNNMFYDEFYYGMFINGESMSDLRESNPYYVPIITEEQFQILKDRHNLHPKVIAKSRTYDIYEEIKTFDNSFIITEDDYHFTFSLPNKKRFDNKIKEGWRKWKKLSLKDVVEPHQVIYESKNKASKYRNYSVRLSDIDEEIIEKLGRFKIWEREFEEYMKFTNTQLDKIQCTNQEKISKKNAEIGRLKGQKKQYIKDNMSIKKDTEESLIYEETKIGFDKKIKFLRKEVENIDDGERNEIFELEVFIDTLNQAQEYYKKADYVRKGKIAKVFFSNILITHEKRLEIQVKPVFKPLFNPIWWS